MWQKSPKKILQGFAAKDLGQAVGLASPYLNEQIKLHTQNADGSVNTTVNLIAHALLGAVEAAATGNNLLAGAAAGATSEAAANVIINTLYQGKSADQLTEAEKQNVIFLSQLASVFAAGIVGNSTQSAAIGAEVGKRAVENNLLSREEDEYVFDSHKLFNKNHSLDDKRKIKTTELLIKDGYINYLIKQYQEAPSKLNATQRNYLATELAKIANSYNIPIEDLYKWNFNSTIKRDDSKLSNYLAKSEYFWNHSYEGKQAKSFAMGLSSLPFTYGGDKLVRLYPQVTEFVVANPVKSEAAVVLGYGLGKQTTSGEYDIEGLGKDVGKTFMLGRLPLGQQVVYGTATDFIYEVNKRGATDQSITEKMIGSGAGVVVSSVSELGSRVEPKLNGVNKVIFNVIGGDKISDYIREEYKGEK